MIKENRDCQERENKDDLDEGRGDGRGEEERESTSPAKFNHQVNLNCDQIAIWALKEIDHAVSRPWP